MPVREQPPARLQSDKLGKPLALPIVFGLAAKLNGVDLEGYLSSAEVLAACQLSAAQTFNYDAVYVYADNAVNAQALGAQVDWTAGLYPRVIAPVLNEPEDIAALIQTDPGSGRRGELLKACMFLRKAVGNNKLIVGTVLGPMSLASQLLGLERLLFLAVDEPQRLEKLLDQTYQLVNNYAMALAQAGADVLMLYEPVASPAVITRDILTAHLLPLYKKLSQNWSEAEVLVWLHIVGPIRRFLNLLSQVPADLLTVDDGVSWSEARAAFPETYLVGNLPAPSFAVSESKLIKKVATQAKSGADRRTILGTDCELPLDTKPDNLKALIEIAKIRSEDRQGEQVLTGIDQD